MLGASAIGRQTYSTGIVFAIRCYDEIGSTNEEIKRLIARGAPEGAVVTSIVQTGGYGRQGRRWSSPAGSLYLSLLLRPLDHGVNPIALPTLSLVVALAVREVLAARAGEAALSVKWPNDVLCDRGKLCGISLEAVGGAVCVGIGINIFEPETAPETTGAFRAAYLEQIADFAELVGIENTPGIAKAVGGARALGVAKAPDGAERRHEGRDDVLESVAGQLLSVLDRRYSRWLDEGFRAFLDEYNEHSFLDGMTVGIASMSGEMVDGGKVVRVDECGNLVLLAEDGLEHAVASGEAHIVL